MSQAINLAQLKDVVETHAAIRRIQRLQPVGGPGDKVFPVTYPGERDNSPARHVFETRRIGGQDTRCVLLDSVQSQANRLEQALLEAMRQGRISLPHIVVDFTKQKLRDTDISDLGEITSLDAPHRVFDAIIRDSEQSDGKRFTETEIYKQLLLAKSTHALKLFELSPTALLFGVWNSTGEGGGIGAKFARCIVSEIFGVGAAEGQKGAIRIDPLGIRASVKVLGGPLDWKIATGAKGEKSLRPSEINHSNAISNLTPGGVTIDYAVHTAVVSCAALRRLRFPDPRITDESAGRAVLAATALMALTEQDRAGYALRSRCDLVCETRAPFELIAADGSTEAVHIGSDQALKLLQEAVTAAKAAGFPWNTDPIRLKPQKRLVELVALSRAKVLAGEVDSAQDS